MRAAASSSSASSSASWVSSLSGFLFAAASNPADGRGGAGAVNGHTSHAASQLYALQQQHQQGSTGLSSALLLDVPDIYRNTNAGVHVDVHGQPLRPDDALLKASLRHCCPDQVFYNVLSVDSEGCNAVGLTSGGTPMQVRTSLGGDAVVEGAQGADADMVHAMVRALNSALNFIIASAATSTPSSSRSPSRSGSDLAYGEGVGVGGGGMSNWNHASCTSSTDAGTGLGDAGDDDSPLFPDHLLAPVADSAEGMDPVGLTACLEGRNVDGTTDSSGRDVAVSAAELDAVVVLEWASMVIFSARPRMLRLWPVLFGETNGSKYHNNKSILLFFFAYIIVPL